MTEPSPERTILIRLSGPDHTGITAALMELLDSFGCTIEDVEQIVTRGRLTLEILVKFDAMLDPRALLLLFGYERKLAVEFEDVSSEPSRKAPGLVVTILGQVVKPEDFGAIAALVSVYDGNIDRIVRLGRKPVMAFELAISCTNRDGLRVALLSKAHELKADLAVHNQGIGRRNKRLVVMDVDSTLIQDEAIELVAAEAGSLPEVARITDSAMAGEINFNDSLEERVATLAGVDTEAFGRITQRIRLTPGARTFIRTLKGLGYKTAIVSGGFTFVTDYLAEHLGIDYSFANTLEVSAEDKLTGRTTGAVVDQAGKATILRHLAEIENIPVDQVVAVGDGANDLAMLDAAGLGIAFNARAVVQRAADTALNVPYLDAILFVLGLHQEELEDAGFANTGPIDLSSLQKDGLLPQPTPTRRRD